MHRGLSFDEPVAPGGYGWWYCDATSDDGAHGLTLILFVGSVFSPWYRASGRRDPEDHCAINLSLTGPESVWAMTERPRAATHRQRDAIAIGPSVARRDGDALVIDIDERSHPLPWRVRGQVRIVPEVTTTTGFMLDPAGRHRWAPIAPRARVEVTMRDPDVRWRGSGYLDSNFGDEPLEDGFSVWHWARAHLRRDVAVVYDGVRKDGRRFDLALRCDRTGAWHDMPQPSAQKLPRTRWLIDRRTRAEAPPRVRKTWIDAPFYARSEIETRLLGEDAVAIHETLSLTRLASPVVQRMLPYRIARRR